MCAWNTRFGDRYVAPKLSHHNLAAGGWGILNSLSKVYNHISFVVAFANDLYSASVLDPGTVACFLELHEIILGPRNIANPPVDLWSLGHPAQSASENLLSKSDEDFTNLMPCWEVPLT
jgi:hypothetical protein